MALLFDANGEIVTFTDSSLDDLDPFTYLAWVNKRTTGDTDVIFSKDDASTISRKLFASGLSGSETALRISVVRDSGNSDYRTATGILNNDEWTFASFTFDSGATPPVHIYRGTLSAIAVEPSYTLETAGGGSLFTEASGDLGLGGTTQTGTVFFDGDIAVAAVLDRVLTLGECQSWQFRPRVISGTRLFSHPGFNGTANVPDWSGNVSAGVVTGATVANHIPLGPPFGFDIPKIGIATVSNIDTRAKRFCMMNTFTTNILLPEADAGGIEADDRAMLLGLYCGIPFDAPVSVGGRLLLIDPPGLDGGFGTGLSL